MRTELLGLELDQALALLRAEGKNPAVRETRSPRRREQEGGRLLVVSAAEDEVIVSRFFDPISDPQS